MFVNKVHEHETFKKLTEEWVQIKIKYGNIFKRLVTGLNKLEKIKYFKARRRTKLTLNKIHTNFEKHSFTF